MAGLATGAAVLGARTARAAQPLHLSTNQYSWSVFYQREGRDFNASPDAGFKDVAASGLNGFEPGLGTPVQVDELIPHLKKHGLQMRSVYVGSTLHTREDARKSIENLLAIATRAKTFGTRIIVTNPNPLKWGGAENKSDAQLVVQAEELNNAGRKLSEMGMTLAFHNHDIELRNAAREFHHMMLGTDPKYVTLCLDAHWVFRGAGNSSVALFDIVKLYGSRVTELHLRQSTNGVWSEVFGEGDIDYPALARALARAKAKPHLVLEVAVEAGTPKTMDPVEVHRRSGEYARRVFG